MATITFSQSPHGAYTTNESPINGAIGNVVTVSNSAALSGQYKLEDVPAGSAVPTGNLGSPGTTATFTPDVPGGYLVGLWVAGARVAALTFVVPDYDGAVYPAYQSTGDQVDAQGNAVLGNFRPTDDTAHGWKRLIDRLQVVGKRFSTRLIDLAGADYTMTEEDMAAQHVFFFSQSGTPTGPLTVTYPSDPPAESVRFIGNMCDGNGSGWDGGIVVTAPSQMGPMEVTKQMTAALVSTNAIGSLIVFAMPIGPGSSGDASSLHGQYVDPATGPGQVMTSASDTHGGWKWEAIAPSSPTSPLLLQFGCTALGDTTLGSALPLGAPVVPAWYPNQHVQTAIEPGSTKPVSNYRVIVDDGSSAFDQDVVFTLNEGGADLGSFTLTSGTSSDTGTLTPTPPGTLPINLSGGAFLNMIATPSAPLATVNHVVNVLIW